MSIEEMINSERVLNELGIWQKEVIARVMQNYADQEKKKEAIAILHWIYPANTDKENEQLYELFKKQK